MCIAIVAPLGKKYLGSITIKDYNDVILFTSTLYLHTHDHELEPGIKLKIYLIENIT